MVKPILFLTRALPEQVMEKIGQSFNLHYDQTDRVQTKGRMMKELQEAEGLISMLNDPIDREIIESASRLKIIANYAVGYNNIDLRAAKEKGVVVTNTPGVLTETTADLTWALLMAVARRIPEADRLVQSKRWTGWAPTELLGQDIYGKTLGIIGMGRIGQAVARRAHGFSMSLIYFSRTRHPEIETDLGVKFLPFQQLLKEADYLSLHLPLNESSLHLIDRRAFQMMKPSAIVINTSRGPIIDEKALGDALSCGGISGAGLDVFEEEPVVSHELLQMNNVITLPHIGSASLETRVKMGQMVLDNLNAYFSNRKPPNMVN